jgi:AdoMet-dependent rRNA methyltransferase SPB1
MLRRSREKALVDASYNRFTWNDAKDLPTWFLDDEMKHNKPQLPVPEALLEQVL